MQGMSRWMGRLAFAVAALATAWWTVAAEPIKSDSSSGSSVASVEDPTIMKAETAGAAQGCSVVDFDGAPEPGTYDVVAAGEVEILPLDGETPRTRRVIHVGEDGEVSEAIAGGIQEKLVYSNTEGKFVISPGANFLLADDISTNAKINCPLQRYRITVTGRANPGGIGGAYTVDYGMYTDCPGAGGTLIPGTSGSLSIPAGQADDLIDVEFQVPAQTTVLIPTHMYFGVKFNRINAGIVGGTPALLGYASTRVDVSGFACANTFGPFPPNPYAAFNLQIYGDQSCVDAFAGYRNVAPNRSALVAGTNVLIADDYRLDVASCQMVALDVAVKGNGFYTFEFRSDAGFIPGAPILNTSRSFINSVGAGVYRPHRFLFDPPVLLPKDGWLTARVNNSTGGWILTGRDAGVGRTAVTYAQQGTDGSWQTIAPPGDPTPHGGFHFVITCQGQPPKGACCDMFVTDDNNESVCRDVPFMNCPFPPRDTIQQPAWQQGVSCKVCSGGVNNGLGCQTNDNCPGGTCGPNQPFLRPCGQSACCEPNGDCSNRTLNECNAIEPVAAPRLWQRGRYCNIGGQQCPDAACLGREGSCTQPRGKLCKGGVDHGLPCLQDSGCTPVVDGTCNFGTGLCASGDLIGQPCAVSADCRMNGVCNLDTLRCEGGKCGVDGVRCFGQADRACRCGICDGQRGCENPFCCTAVCNIDPFCCQFEWDQECATIAAQICSIQPENDFCAPQGQDSGARELQGALLLSIPSVQGVDLARATMAAFDPGFCCHKGPGRYCVGGVDAGRECNSDLDCFQGTCPVFEETPGAQGVNGVWFQFRVPPKTNEQDPDFVSVQISTCGSNNPAKDSLIQVFSSAMGSEGVCSDLGRCSDGSFCRVSVGNCADASTCQASVETCNIFTPNCALGATCSLNLRGACESLTVIGCNDDNPGACGATQARNSQLCLSNLERGETYFLHLAAKDASVVANYRLALTAVGSCPAQPVPNDYCRSSIPVGEGSTPFDLDLATFACPGPPCLGSSRNDLWYDYTPDFSGEATIETCTAPLTPDTEMSIYLGCDCPVSSATPGGATTQPIQCSGFGPDGPCLNGSKVTMSVIGGQCYKIRVGDRFGDGGAGDLTINFSLEDCNGNGIPDNCDIDCGEDDGPCDVPGCGLSADCNANGIPDECDISAGTSQDVNGNGIPDECEPPTSCPVGAVTWVNPPNGVVDARYEVHPSTGAPLGISTIVVNAPAGADTSCWSLCETADTGSANDIVSVIEDSENPGTYTLTLARPITTRACSTITYTNDASGTSTASFRAHPGNADADSAAAPSDILRVIDFLNNVNPAVSCPWGLYSCDIDHSGVIGAADILGVIDALNGSGQLSVANNTPLPLCAACP